MAKKLLRVYLDNCCYNRPYDDQSQIRISLESQAEIFIQDVIKIGSLELAASHVLLYENSKRILTRTDEGQFMNSSNKIPACLLMLTD